jgi:hypothetical protein
MVLAFLARSAIAAMVNTPYHLDSTVRPTLLHAAKTFLHCREEGAMSDGREEREEQEKLREQEVREDLEDQIDVDFVEESEPERVDS